MPPIRQKAWGWPAIAVLTLGGTGAGFYIVSAMEELMRKGTSVLSSPVLFGLAGVAIAAMGFVTLAAETGRPFRALSVRPNIGTSWMAREVMFFGLFAALAIADRLFPSAPFWVASLLAAACFIVSQGFVVYRSRAVAAWDVPVMPVLFFLSGLLSGFGGVLLAAAMGYLPISTGLLLVGLTILVSHAAVWIIYIFGTRTDAFIAATRKLREPGRLAFFLLLSFVAPFVLMCVILYAEEGERKDVPSALGAIAGITLLFSAAVEKIEVIRTGGSLRAIFLRK